MGRVYQKDNSVWKKQLGYILKCLFSQYNLDYNDFAEQYNWSASTVRYWFEGRSCPKAEGLADIKEYFYKNISNNRPCEEQIYEEIRKFFENQGVDDVYYNLRRYYPAMNTFAGEVLGTCRSFAKIGCDSLHSTYIDILPTGKTQAVVFDFDGTLTSQKLVGQHGKAYGLVWDMM